MLALTGTTMHRELKRITSRAKQQALAANKRGQDLEALAKTLQERYQIVADYGYEMEEYALRMQYHAQHSIMYALLQEQGLYSTDLSIEASNAHVQAVKAQVQAIKLYCQAIRIYVNRRNCSEC